MKWIGFLATAALVIACFYPWVFIESKNYVVSGVAAENIRLGKPAYFHFLMAAIYLVLNFIPRVWAKRWNLLIAALNLAWAIRNYLLISGCSAGECPEKKWALYTVLVSSLLMLIAALFPKITLAKEPGMNSELV
jgi:hypothetical protein